MDCNLFVECPRDLDGKRNGYAYKYIDISIDKILTHTINYFDDKLHSIKYMYCPNNYIILHFVPFLNQLNHINFLGTDHSFNLYLPCNTDWYERNNKKYFIKIETDASNVSIVFNEKIINFDYTEFL